MNLAIISVHGCPVRQAGEKDVGGMNIYLLETAKRIADARATDEGKEGTNAFLNKIKPGWQKND